MSGKKSQEQKDKDRFFEQLAELSGEMIEAHGKDFTMGALVLAARFIAEGKSFSELPQHH